MAGDGGRAHLEWLEMVAEHTWSRWRWTEEVKVELVVVEWGWR